jgi:hypothetical protein
VRLRSQSEKDKAASEKTNEAEEDPLDDQPRLFTELAPLPDIISPVAAPAAAAPDLLPSSIIDPQTTVAVRLPPLSHPHPPTKIENPIPSSIRKKRKVLDHVAI